MHLIENLMWKAVVLVVIGPPVLCITVGFFRATLGLQRKRQRFFDRMEGR